MAAGAAALVVLIPGSSPCPYYIFLTLTHWQRLSTSDSAISTTDSMDI